MFVGCLVRIRAFASNPYSYLWVVLEEWPHPNPHDSPRSLWTLSAGVTSWWCPESTNSIKKMFKYWNHCFFGSGSDISGEHATNFVQIFSSLIFSHLAAGNSSAAKTMLFNICYWRCMVMKMKVSSWQRKMWTANITDLNLT